MKLKHDPLASGTEANLRDSCDGRTLLKQLLEPMPREKNTLAAAKINWLLQREMICDEGLINNER